MRVLLVEDNPFVRSGIADLLKSEGYEVISVADSVQARMVMLNSFCPQVIVLDIILPGESGSDLLKYFAADGKMKSSIPVIVTTASVQDAEDLKDLAWSVILKPYTIDQLLESLTTVWAEYQKQHG